MFDEKLIFKTGGRSNYRIPSIAALTDGTVIAFCNDRKDSIIDHADEAALAASVKKPGCRSNADNSKSQCRISVSIR